MRRRAVPLASAAAPSFPNPAVAPNAPRAALTRPLRLPLRRSVTQVLRVRLLVRLRVQRTPALVASLPRAAAFLASPRSARTPADALRPCSAPCQSYHLRTRALHGDMSNYRCCGGFHPCVGRCGEEKCPQFCLCLEVSICFSSSVLSTRYMIQHEHQIGNSACDDRLICLIVGCEFAACIVSCIDDQLGDLMHTMADGVYCSVCACMQTQHKLQLDARDAGTSPTFATTMMVAPVAQQMQVMQPPMQQPYGYAQPAYGQPQPGYAPQQPQYGYAQQQQPAPMYYAPQQAGGYPAQQQAQYANPMYVPPQGPQHGQGMMR